MAEVPATPEALEHFLMSSPSAVTQDEAGTKSTSTRAPTIYDMHLDSKQTLERVRFLPSIPDYLRGLVDAAIAKIIAEGSHIPMSAADLGCCQDWLTATEDASVTDEQGVVRFYEGTTGKACPPVAFALFFHTSDGNRSVGWTSLPDQTKNAIADGFFKINVSLLNKFRTSLPPEVVAELDMVRRCFPNMATWEFKTIRVAPKEVLEVLVKIAKAGGIYDYITCKSELDCKHRSHYARIGSWRTVTGARMGFDAPVPSIIQLNQPSDAKSLDATDTGHPSIPVAGRVKLEQDPDDRKAHYIIQQGWAQNVKVDGTWSVYQTGECEIICFRHRATRTLYLSDVINTNTPGYAKLQVGLYMAMLKDAIERSRLWIQAEEAGTLPRQYSYDPDAEAHEGEAATQNSEILFEEVRAYNNLTVCSSARLKGEPVCIFLSPTAYSRLGSLGARGQSDSADPIPAPPPRINVILTHKVDIFTYKATLEVGSAFLQHALFVKLALDPHYRQRMDTEVEIYTHLHSKGVVGIIPEVIGIFDAESAGRVLLTRDSGKSLAERKTQHLPRLTPNQRTAFTQALNALHKAGVIFEKPETISEFTLLVDEQGNVSIIGLADATMAAATPARKKSSTTGRRKVPCPAKSTKFKKLACARLQEILQAN